MPSQAVSVNQDRLVQTFVEMARCNTPPRHERAAAEIACRILTDIGFECQYDDAGEKLGGDIGNLIAFKKGSVTGATPIFFSAHFDTVEPTPGLEPIIDGDVIRSDGNTIVGADDLCGMAPILEGMRLLVEQQIPHGDIQLLLTVCEEIGLVGASVMDPGRARAELGFVLDAGPPVGSFVISAPSQDIFEARIKGRAAHAGAQPEDGINAIAIAARAIARMTLGRVDAETTANVGIIQGGLATNIIPEDVYLKCEARSRDPEKLEYQRASMIHALRTEAEAVGGSVDIQVNRIYEHYNLPLDSPILNLAEAACARAGLPFQTRVTGGGADANIFNTWGIPTTVLGCGMVNIHRHDEYCTISDMVRSTQLVVALVQEAAKQE